MTGPARVAGKAHAHRNARTRTQRGAELVNRRRRWKVCDLFNIYPRVVVTLIFLGIGVPFEIGEFQAGAVRHCPCFLLLVVLGAELRENLFRPGDDFRELDELAAEEDADRTFAVQRRVLKPVPDGGLGFPASPRTAVKHLEDRTFQQRGLRPWLRGPENCLLRLNLEHALPLRPGFGRGRGWNW